MTDRHEAPEPPNLLAVRSVVDKMTLPVVGFDTDLNLTYANSAALDLLGADNFDSLKGVPLDRLIAQEHLSFVRTGIARLVDGLPPSSVSIRIVRVDGVQVPVEAFASLIPDGHGTEAGFMVYLLDMSRREVVEERMRAKSDILQLIVEHSHVGIVVVDDDYRFEFVNSRFCDILGRTHREVLGHDFREFLHPDDVPLVADRYRRRQRGEEVPRVYEFRVMHSSGEPRYVQVHSTVLRTSDGKVKSVAQILDITETVESKRALEDSEYKFRSLVETMVDGLAIDDEDGALVYANNALVRMLGYSSTDDLISKHDTEIIYGITEEQSQARQAARRAGITERYSAQLVHRSGRLIPVVVSAAPLFDAHHRYKGSFAIFTDVSELRQAEAEARFLLDLLLHDIGNQLQLIMAGVDLCDPDAPEKTIRSSQQYVRSGAQKCIDLIAKVRSIEQAKGVPMQPVNLTEVLESEVSLIRQMYDVDVKYDGAPTVWVMADSALSQMLWNILENAVRHNPRDDPTVWVHGVVKDGLFELTVSDNGPGLSGEALKGLFSTGRRFGGVGLHIVRTLADKYGVSLHVDHRIRDDPSSGLTFRLIFNTVPPPDDH